jgi:signal transduction histidine kinase
MGGMSDVPGNEIQRLQTLLETVRLLNSTLELKELTGIILEVVRAEIAVERISVFVVDRSRNILQPLVTQEIQGEEISLPVGVGIAGTVAATGEVLDIADAYADPRFDRSFDGKYGYYTNDLFALPVCNRSGDVVGVLELLNRLRPISPSDREFLLGISVYIGLALENSFLHAQALAREEIESGSEPETVQTVRGGIQDPLTFARGYLQLLPNESDLPASAWAHLETFRRGISEVTAAAVKFQESVEEQTQALAPMSLSDELRLLSQMRAAEWERNNIQATLVAEKAPPVYAHEYEIRLVLSFLIRNAEAAILQSNSNRHLRIHSWCAGKKVHVSIHHKGLGGDLSMSPGFAIANSIVQKYNGQIRFESASGKGTTYLIELPIQYEPRLAE